MKYQLLTTLVAITFCLSLAAEDWQSPQLKTFSSSQQECAVYLLLPNETAQRCVSNGYPDEWPCRKLINCILVQFHAFDELTGIKDHVITNFFDPSGAPSDYVSRTQECLRTTVPNHCQGQPFERAYRSFQCYYRNYGSLLTDTVRFIPYEQVDRIQHLKEAFSIANTSCKAIKDFSEGHGFNVEEISDPLYVLAVRTGFYDHAHGPYTDRLYTQFGSPNLLSEATRQCITRVSQQYSTEPILVTQLFFQCVEEDISTEALFTETARQILATTNSYCNVCEPVSPVTSTTEMMTTTTSATVTSTTGMPSTTTTTVTPSTTTTVTPTTTTTSTPTTTTTATTTVTPTTTTTATPITTTTSTPSTTTTVTSTTTTTATPITTTTTTAMPTTTTTTVTPTTTTTTTKSPYPYPSM
nr:cell wall protein DAN4-like [Aedes albopictus]